MHIRAIGTATATFFDFLIHTTRNEVARRQIFEGWRVAFHKTFAVFIQKNAALASYTLSDQHTRTGNARGVKLPEFHIHHGDSSPRGHTHAVASIDESIGRSRPDAPCTTRRNHGCLSFKNVRFAGFHLERCDAQHVTRLITDQI